MTVSTRITAVLSVCAMLSFGVGVSMAQSSEYMKCTNAHFGCYPMGPDGCFENSGICQDYFTGVVADFDGFNNLARLVGSCGQGEGTCDDQTSIQVCSTIFYKSDILKTCATPVCNGRAFSKACPNPE